MSSKKFSVTLSCMLMEAEQRVRDALRKEQFGVISEVNIQEKLKEKLGVDHPPHKILGACNPKLAYQALQDNVNVALVLPCNVVLMERDGKTTVSALLPSVVLKPFEGSKVREAALTAEAALKRVFDSLQSPSRS